MNQIDISPERGALVFAYTRLIVSDILNDRTPPQIVELEESGMFQQTLELPLIAAATVTELAIDLITPRK